MEKIISKELLGEVLGYKPFKIDKIKRVDGVGLTLVLLNQDGTVRSYQNIYELAHKCKEWAYKQSSYSIGYAIKTVHYGDSVVGVFSGIRESYIDNCKTEYELVFKLCQWLLDNKKEIKC